ncbi:MAG: hypothetical protein JNM18_03330 [Planctomycetaceae bacterium]|nr:hypothetical protein [Planctomycetaceae bacterium]
MRHGWVIAGCMMLALLGGCRNRAAQELLERDLRVQEDIIYDLEDEVKALMSENEALRQMAFSGTPVEAPARSSSSSTTPSTPRREEPPRMPDRGPDINGRPQPDELKPPMIELPLTGRVAPFEGPPAIIAPGEGFPEGELPGQKPTIPAKPASLGSSTAGQGPTMAGPTNATARSEDVMTITLHEQVTAGYNDDGQPGDDGIHVVVEPRGSDNQIIPAAAKISAVLMDPLLAGNSARIGRWDFTAEQAGASYAKSAESDGLHLELPWYQSVPGHSELLLFVRYHTADGRKLDADRSLTISLRPQEQRTLPGQVLPQVTSQPPSQSPRQRTMPTQPPMPGYRAQPTRRSPYSSTYDRIPTTTQRSVWNRSNAGPTARLLPPEFQNSATPLDSAGPQPGPVNVTPSAPSPPANNAAPNNAPPSDTTTTARPRSGAKWSPYR